MKKLFLLLLIFASVSMTAQEAESTENETDKNGWQFDVAPYLWLADVEGDISFFNRMVPFEAEFSNIITNLESGFMLHAEVSKGKFFGLGDLLFLRIGQDGTFQATGARTDLTLNQIISELALGYTFFETGNGIYIDGLLGFRYYQLDTQLEVDSRSFYNRFENFSDPLVGVRLRAESNRFSASVRGDVGGFGVGSDFSWKSNVIFGYHFSKLVSVHAGFQAYGFDRESDQLIREETFVLDMTTAGFLFGLNVHID